MTLPTAAASTTRRKFCGICPAIVFPWFVWFPCRNSLCIERFLEFEADPRGSGEGGGVEEAAGWTSEPVVHAGPEGAEVAVEALGEAIVGEQRRRPEPEQHHHPVGGVVGDGGAEGVARGVAESGQPRHLRRGQRGGGDGVVLLGVVGIDRAATPLDPQLQLRGGVGGAAGA